MKIVVLAGGLSPERDVSLSSGALIANALIEMHHEVMLLDLYLGAKNPDIAHGWQNLATGVRFSYQIPPKEPDLAAIKAASGNGEMLIGDDVLTLCREADLVFLALHGASGENGQLQALLDLYAVPYTGSGYVGSLLAMDKDLSKQIMHEQGIPTPSWRRVELDQTSDFSFVRYPCVVKPCSCGSSVGVTIAENAAEFAAAIEYARQYESAVLIEEKIVGREFSIGVLGGKALPVIEIRPKSGFYDYANKYQKGRADEICPAEIGNEIRELLQTNAVRVHNALRLGFYSRIDFIVDESGQAWCLEANTLPGMTPTSLLPQEALAAGIGYNELCDKIARGALRQGGAV
ncbi:MAG: D-alanine--D-alanine ligase [Clostridia bacterium]|nr:D-alanine--D-alanine ligase [Clostridia bacterium]